MDHMHSGMLAVQSESSGLRGRRDTLETDVLEPAPAATGLPKRNYFIFCDESGIHGAKYYAFGTLWLPYERRGDFLAAFRRIRDRHRYDEEIKWKKVSRYSLPFYKDVVSEFFRRKWMMFHGIVVRRDYVASELHRCDAEAWQKHLTMLLTKKIRRFGSPTKRYHVRTDPIPSSYENAHEVVRIVGNHALQKDIGLRPIDSIRECDSKLTLGIQLADLLTGALVGAFEDASRRPEKQALRQDIARHLGWSDLRGDTWPWEWKFNAWYFKDPKDGEPRYPQTRDVRLLHPMRPAADVSTFRGALAAHRHRARP